MTYKDLYTIQNKRFMIQCNICGEVFLHGDILKGGCCGECKETLKEVLNAKV
jgi:hypothetical protein